MYSKPNKSFLARKAYLGWVSNLVMQKLRGTGVVNKKMVGSSQNREKRLVAKLDAAIFRGIAAEVLAVRMALD